MELRNALLRDFEAAYNRLKTARSSGDESAIRHAEGNFQACAESLAKRVPMLLENGDDWSASA